MKLKHACKVLFISVLLSLSSIAFAEMVNINKADARALMENLPGIGEVKAKAIVDYRKKNGSFKRVEDLMNVPGIGKSTFNNLKSEVSTSKGATKATGKKPITSTKQLSKDGKASKASSKATIASSTKTAAKAKDKAAKEKASTDKKSSTVKTKDESKAKKTAAKDKKSKATTKKSKTDKKKSTKKKTEKKKT